MIKRNIIIGLLILSISLTAYGQTVVVDGDTDGPTFVLSGGVTGMFTLGFMDEDQVAGRRVNEGPNNTPGFGPAPGVYYGEETDKVGPGETGYYGMMNFSMMFSPVPYFETFIKFLAQYRPGSPYIPLQLEESDPKTFSDFSIDSAYARVNAIEGLGLDLPLDIWLKAGKFDTTASYFNRVARHGSERTSVLGSLRTTNQYSMQLEAAYHLPFLAETFSLGFTTNMKLKDSIPVLLDDDDFISGIEIWHGDPKTNADIPFHASLKLENIFLPFSEDSFASIELIYAYNAMHIFSGNNFGIGLGATMSFGDITIPIGLSAAFYGKNIDPIAGMAQYGDECTYFSLYERNGFHFDPTAQKSWDSNTISNRQSFRAGFDAGVQYTNSLLSVDCNLGFIYSQVAHIYRDTLSLLSLTAGLQAAIQDRYFIGGGIFLGSLTDTEWKTKADVDPAKDDFFREFKLAENLGFEVFGGLMFGNNAKLVLGYNVNKGLSMNNYIEALPDAQIKYRQKDSNFEDGLFERGGFFTKLVFSW